jgi:mercuric ion transport protein
MPDDTTSRAALMTGGVAAVLASACCLGPLVLVSIGLGGAWVANLTALEPYRPVFIAVALAALVLAFRHVYRPVEQCKPGEVCAVPAVRRGYRIVFWVVAALVAIALGFPYVARLFY